MQPENDWLVYPASIIHVNEAALFMASVSGQDMIIADKKAGFFGKTMNYRGKEMVLGELNHENACVLREILPFTAPVPVLHSARSMGVGDRLGIATEGHINVFMRHNDVMPVFAQQSYRELNQTGRTYREVLDCVSFSVFKKGYKRGFGADGDHLKTEEQVQDALASGYSMITLDCSDHIRNDIYSMDDRQIDDLAASEDIDQALYVGKNFILKDGMTLAFDEVDYKRMVLIYQKAIEFALHIYNKFLKNGKFQTDFEISIDETNMPTTPLQHYYVANELKRFGVAFASLAPRFCGEFQKGVDYIGDISQFERDLKIHVAIAEHFGYKISIHSGSDKFSIFPAIGRITQGKYHLKTSGTSWLEALRIIALKNSGLYRELYKFAISVLAEAKKNYHVTCDVNNLPNIDNLSDNELPDLFQQNDARQLLHITYGYILREQESQGNYSFKDRLYTVLQENRKLYYQVLDEHIGKHLEVLKS